MAEWVKVVKVGEGAFWPTFTAQPIHSAEDVGSGEVGEDLPHFSMSGRKRKKIYIEGVRAHLHHLHQMAQLHIGHVVVPVKVENRTFTTSSRNRRNCRIDNWLHW